MQLLRINHHYPSDTAALTSSIDTLIICTWLKWLLLAILLLIPCKKFLQMNVWSRIASVPLIIPVILGIAALLINQRNLEDWFATSVFGGFLILILYSFLYQSSKVEKVN